ncbi:uncharacterized protein LOC124924191 [Impatiens glandulifera]|uniref:uncharacterized protein LOC124924191 n=1 Tax=Impatiens glandulifera TaxID=253017 RepID=UPI001FB14911|nr:uncharacterized protein LOC124924191 [Impatiens glandulifera]
MESDIVPLGVRKGAWTAEEDTLLSGYILKHGEGSLHLIPKNTGLHGNVAIQEPMSKEIESNIPMKKEMIIYMWQQYPCWLQRKNKKRPLSLIQTQIREVEVMPSRDYLKVSVEKSSDLPSSASRINISSCCLFISSNRADTASCSGAIDSWTILSIYSL